MADNLTEQRCAHPACDCLVTGGEKYCSPHCETALEAEPVCGCGHGACLTTDDRAFAAA